MAEIHIRQDGHAGRITLNRPHALNSVTYEMCRAIEAALDDWRADNAIALVIIDAVGTRAFSAGGDIQDIYARGRAGDVAYAQKFWADEYRMNAKIATYPKPYVALMQGYTMGGGVGVSCHGSHRIVGESSRIAMPECGIGLVPDVGGSYILSQSPGHVGKYLGLTTTRMTADDAIYARFADYFVPQSDWTALTQALCRSGDADVIAKFIKPAPTGTLRGYQTDIDRLFGDETLAAIYRSLASDPSQFAAATLEKMRPSSPLSMAVAVEMAHRLRAGADIITALECEYRYTFRALEHSDFLEGIRAQIIDKDRAPVWKHREIAGASRAEIDEMLAPLGDDELNLKEKLT